MKDHRDPGSGGGVPGAGWFIAAVFVFSVVMFTGWEQGWWEGSRNSAAAPTAAHRTTNGAGNSARP